MRVTVHDDDGSEIFDYETDLDKGHLCLHPGANDVSAALFALFTATMFLSRAFPRHHTDPEFRLVEPVDREKPARFQVITGGKEEHSP